jgi:Flp pilus assembly protein TadD
MDGSQESSMPSSAASSQAPVAIPVAEAIPVAPVVASPYAAAARHLEVALKAGAPDPHVAYLLALAYKRERKPAEARQALRKIARPDANVLLQLGLLSLQEKQLGQAEQEFARAWETDPGFYEACHNLLLTRLTLDLVDRCEAMLPQALQLAPSPGERRFLDLLQALLRRRRPPDGDPGPATQLAEMTPEDEVRLLELIRSLGQLETALAFLKALAQARPDSASVQQAYAETALVQARLLFDRYAWAEAEQLLAPLAREKRTDRTTQTALINLLGCCACMNQDFEEGVRHFTAALRLVNNDPRIHQNLALAHELQGQLAQAEPYWIRFFDLLDGRLPYPPGQVGYPQRLAFEGLMRLAGLYAEKEKWHSALPLVQRAAQMRPQDTEVLERLFQLYGQLKRPDEARRTLRRLRELKPNEPQYDLYELDLIEAKSLKDIERILSEIERIRARYPNDARVEERAVRMVGNVVPLMSNLCDQLTEQMSKIIDQVRRLPNYQINWPAVHEAMRDLVREFRKLRRITGKCYPLVTSDEHRRIIRELSDHIDRKIEVCQSMGG